LLERTKLSYEDFSPAMIADSSIPTNRPKQILTLNDLYPYINTLHRVDSSEDPASATAHAEYNQKVAATAAALTAHAASH
jgi:hypothetical protein